MREMSWFVIPLILLIVIGLFVGFAIEVVVYIAPFLRIIFFCGAALSLLTLPFFFFKKLRYVTGFGFISLSLCLGAFTYIDGFTTSYDLGGKPAVIGGTFLMIYGVVLVAIFLSSVNGAFIPALIFVAMATITYALWKVGEKILSNHDNYIRKRCRDYEKEEYTIVPSSIDRLCHISLDHEAFDDLQNMPDPRSPLSGGQQPQPQEGTP